MENVAIIDLGTNTFNMLVAGQTGDGEFRKVFSHRIPVMMGEGTINSNIISPAPFQRGISALREFRSELEKYGVKTIIALATSAIRSAKNGEDFILAVKAETNIDVRIISGDKEAELIFLGNARAAALGDEPSLVMDIGGGSTEFIIGNKNGIIWKKSFLLGAARLLDRFQPEDPIRTETISSICSYFDQELADLFGQLKEIQVNELIGSSGAFDSFVEMIDAEYGGMNFSEKKICYDFDLAQFDAMYERVVSSTLAERRQMKGLLPMRIEMIVISFLFTNYILKKCKIKRLRSTTWSLKEGALLEYLSSR